jgi:hypothetical protein
MVLLRYGIGISVICHVAALIGLMFASAAPFESRPAEAITVDIVTPDEVPSTPAVPPLELTAEAASESSLKQASSPAPQPSPEPPPDASQPPSSVPLPSQSADDPPASEPIRPSPAMPAPSPSEVPVTAGPAPNMANLFSMPVTLPDGSIGPNFDTQAYDLAKLDASDTAAFRDHVKSCATLPGSVAPTDQLRIVLRVSFKPDGTLSRAPDPIEWKVAAGKGPALIEAAIKALRACQPYAMLPASKYMEWKILDLSFTPKDLAGG